MLAKEFIAHLAGRGGLRNGHAGNKGLNGAAESAFDTVGDDVDWLELTQLTPTAFADELAAFYGCDRVQRSDLLNAQFAGEKMSWRFLRERRLFPFIDGSGVLALAVAAPTDREAVRAIELALRGTVAIRIATSDDIDAALTTRLESAKTNPTVAAETVAAEDNLDELRDLARGAPVVRAIDDLLRLAVEQRATDLHIEPFGQSLQVRLRVDGLLRTVPPPPATMAKGLLSRLKIMAGLNITERRLPQDGRARIVVNGAEIDLRVATMPTLHGESGVIRLLRKGSGVVALDKLGLSERDVAILRATLQAPFGMIIVTGPTGSGKTTTLAASLAEINESTRKILTIEDPVEYQIPGINQTQIHPAIGLTFATALRSFLRQDPDVIMVGEMRDSETAHIGVHASLTGHLVLTTLHTNTAAGAITRLIDMNVESFLLSSCVRAIVGQRLIRVLCDYCKEQRVLSAADLSQESKYAALGFVSGDTVFHPKGCEWCGFSGFRGRKGVFEVIEVTSAVRRAIGPKTDATELERVARSEGMITMTEDGVAKCRSGLTTIDEIFRVAASL
ncbi:MAG TPA: GspE/PulE family protein [Xanthobacteraceae bacterium]|nr:GspE/PulE family protein [Xanthobacteraceae bacterium]